MKYAIAIFATGALITGLKAAYHWYQSSEVQIDPGWTAANPETVDRDLRQMAQHGAIIEAAGRSAMLNKIAARWTAASVVFRIFLSATSFAGRRLIVRCPLKRSRPRMPSWRRRQRQPLRP